MDCIAVGNDYGIRLTGTHGSVIMNSTVTGSHNSGIFLADSGGNAIYLNKVTGNQYGISVTGSSSGNTIYMNVLSDNPSANGLGNGLNNYWNSSIPIAYGYGGRQFSGYPGNYWGGLNGQDANGDGILDTSVMLAQNNGDYSPLAVAPTDRPEADFTSDSTSGAAPLPVQFSDRSKGYLLSWHWDFGDGSASDSQNPAHVYQKPGQYTVSLTVKSARGEDTVVKGPYINAGTVQSPTPTATPKPTATPEPWPTITPRAQPTVTPAPTQTPKPTPGFSQLISAAAIAGACALAGLRRK